MTEGPVEIPRGPDSQPRKLSPQQIDQSVRSVIYGHQHPPQEFAIRVLATINSSLDEVLASRPNRNNAVAASVMEETLQSLHKPVNRHRVAETVKRVREKTLEAWAFTDNNHSLPHDNNFYLSEHLSPYLRNRFHVEDLSRRKNIPAAIIQDDATLRRMITDIRISLAAADQISAQLPQDATDKEKGIIDKWKESRKTLLTALVTSWGIERTALVFNNKLSNTDFADNFSIFMDWLKNHKPQAQQPGLKEVVIKMNDFVRQNFWWAEESGFGYPASHAQDVFQATAPLLSVAESWMQRPEYRESPELETAFDPQAAMIRLKQKLAEIPVDQQSAFRRSAVEQIKKEWARSIVAVAKQIRQGYEALAQSPHDFQGKDILAQKIAPLATSLHLNSTQRHEIAKSAALLEQRVVNINHFVARAAVTGDYERFCSKTLLGFDPQGQFIIHPKPTGIEFVFQDDRDFDQAYGSNSTAGGFFGVKTDELGKQIPVIVIRQRSAGDYLRKHEGAHALFDTGPTSVAQAVRPGQGFTDLEWHKPNREAVLLKQNNEYGILPRVQDEVVAYIAAGATEDNIRWHMTENPLYDYYGQISGIQTDKIAEARQNYRHYASKAIADGYRVKNSFGLTNEDCAALLAILPIDQWHHLANIVPVS